MFDLGWSELMFVAVIAVLILGPKELPKAMRSMAKWVRKARMLAGDFQRHVDDVVRESELEELRTEANKIANQDIGKQIDKAVDPDGSVSRGLKFDDAIDPTGPSVKAAKAADKAAGEGAAKADSGQAAETAAKADTKTGSEGSA